jgi:hypothetical protein
MVMAWTQKDRQFLRGLRVQADAEPPPLPRFHAEAGSEGEHCVFDALLKRNYIFDGRWPDPKATAESCAEQWNAEYEKASESNDGA